MFQAYYLVARLTALENVALVADISLNPLHLIDASHIIGLKDSANHFSSKSSGDDQSRRVITRTIANDPRYYCVMNPLALRTVKLA